MGTRPVSRAPCMAHGGRLQQARPRARVSAVADTRGSAVLFLVNPACRLQATQIPHAYGCT
eukprot:4733676-Lingulodinium_polyedra.AAC.1